MPKPAADPIADANREFWRRVREDESYRRWMLERLRDLIERCEFPERTAELVKTLKEVEARVSDGK